MEFLQGGQIYTQHLYEAFEDAIRLPGKILILNPGSTDVRKQLIYNVKTKEGRVFFPWHFSQMIGSRLVT